MESQRHNKFTPKVTTLLVDHNPYEVKFFNPKKSTSTGKRLIFPIFNYQSDKQFVDLINYLVESGFKVVTINLLMLGDRVMFFNYYYTVFERILELLVAEKLIEKDDINLIGVGIGANLVSYMNQVQTNLYKISKIFLISPVNRYKAEYRISHEIAKFKIPTYVFFGQFDKVCDVETRYAIYSNGKKNRYVHFFAYPKAGHYLYYDGIVSMELQTLYRHSDFDLLVGETNKNKIPFLPSEVKLNDVFFNHLFNILSGRTNPKRIALMVDNPHTMSNSVFKHVELLKEQYENMGYETYIVSLWRKHSDYSALPDDFYIPLPTDRVSVIPEERELLLLKPTNGKFYAKMLAPFDFTYVHLHSEYSIAPVALELQRLTGLKIPFTYHPFWKVYYEKKLGTLVKDTYLSVDKHFVSSPIFKECPLVITTSEKSASLLRFNTGKDVRVIRPPFDYKKYALSKDDYGEIEKLRAKLMLNDKNVLGYVGHGVMEKGILNILSYVQKVKDEIPNIRFTILAEPVAIESLKKIVKKMQIEPFVIFVRLVDDEKLKYYYGLFDALVTTGNFEGQALSYLQAMSVGTPILAKRDTSLEGFLKDEANAYIYSDFYEWVEKVEKIFFRADRKITQSAKETVSKLSEKNYAKDILAIYKELNS